MLAKIVAWGPDRAIAFDRLETALDDTIVLGLVTNLRFLRWLVREPVVRDGQARTDTLDRIWPPDDWPDRTAVPESAWAAAATVLRDGASDTDPWAGAWRINARPAVTIEADRVRRRVALGEDDDTPARSLEMVRAGDVVYLDLGGRSTPPRLAPPPDVDTAARAAATHATGGAFGPAQVIAPMPGSVLRLHVGRDAVVASGDPVVTLEAMKMEHVVPAPIAGRVADLLVRPAEQVTRGQPLAIIEP
jgi:3-methylcrotonyl-CoA carboxylase alpha subunit